MYEPGDKPFSIVENSVFHTNMFFVTAEIGGDQARDLLLHNKPPEKNKEGTNRKPSGPTVKKYSLLMLSGQWYLSPQPIVLSEVEDGFEVSDLNDGQQRLMGLVAASLTNPDIRVPFTFCFDAPRASKWLLDQGRRRTPADYLAMAGEVNAQPLSHAVRMLYAVTQARPYQSIPIWRKLELTPQAYSDFLDAHDGLRYSLQQAREVRAIINPYVGAVLHYLMNREYGPFKTAQFFAGMATGANLPLEDARLKARDFLAIKAREGHKWDGFELLAVLIATVNAWLIDNEKFVARHAFTRLSKSFPELLAAKDLPTTTILTGNSGD